MSFQKLLPKFDFADDRFDWENDSIGVYDRNAKLFSVIAMMYVPVVFALEQVMKYREPFKLTGLLIFWNFLLSILSGYGAYLTVPQGFIFYREKGWTGAVCNLDCYHHPYAVIILLFNLSKMGEFVDTIFLRLRKKPVIFLHWYHHILTMLYCWYGNTAGSRFNCTGWYFAAMNLTVHAVMYAYYGLAAMGYAKTLVKMGVNKVVTVIQLTQMVLGIAIIFQSTECERTDYNGLVLSSVMYGSYLFLFAKLYYDKYGSKRLPPEIDKLKALQKKNLQRFKENYQIDLARMLEDQARVMKRAKEDHDLRIVSQAKERVPSQSRKNKEE